MRYRAACAALIAVSLCGCGLSSTAPAPAPIRIIVRQSPTVVMSLRAPGGSAVQAGALSFATRAAAPVVRGTVSPASATVYIRVPGGGLATVQPRRSGAFSVRTELTPGRNRFPFMAYRLGSITRSTRVTISGASGDVPLDPIHAPAPPTSGGDGRWIGGFEPTEYYPALEAWSVGATASGSMAAGTTSPRWAPGAG